MYITLINKLRGIVKYSAPTSSTISSVSDRRRKTPTPPLRGQTENSFTLIHNIFWEIIKMILDDKKFFICGNIQPDTLNCYPIIEAGYLKIKYE